MPSDDIRQLYQRYRTQAGVGPVGGANGHVSNTYEFATKYRRIEGRPFTLDRFRPLQVLYEDPWPLIDVMKPAQRGVSEWAISYVCFALDQGATHWVPEGFHKDGLNVGYVFPARGDLIEFSKERLSGLKEESNYLAEMFGNDDDRFDSLAFKQVRDSFLYLRGGYSTSGLRSVPFDVLVLDEYDELSPEAVELALKRLNASLVKRVVRISTPTIPGAGISKAFMQSDQRVYQTLCADCGSECSRCGRPMDAPKGTHCGVNGCDGTAGTWNTYDFFRDVWIDDQPYEEWQKWTPVHIEVGNVELRCPHCHQPQSPEARTKPGRWVAMQPEIKRVHGYHIPWWPWPEAMMEIRELALKAVSDNPTSQEHFYRDDLGIPHGAAGGQITEEMLQHLSDALPDGKLPDGPWRDTVLGADVGARVHYSIDSIGPDGRLYVRAMGSVPSVDDLDDLMRRFAVRQAVVDAEPEWHSVLRFCQRWQGRALRCFYPGNSSAVKTKMFDHKDGTLEIQANRVLALDNLYATVAGAGENWPLEFTTNDEVIAHMTNLTRIRVVNDETGAVDYAWTRTGPDHLAHARVYAMLARMTLPQAQTFAPAVTGTRQVVNDFQKIAVTNLGRAAVIGREVPSWIPPAVR